MSEQNNTVEKPIIPTVAYPLKPKSNSNKNVLQQYFNQLSNDPSSRFLFNQSGLWHQGIHLRADKFNASEFHNEEICAIADGKLLAYKVDSEYKSDPNTEKGSNGAIYSTGFFLLEHHLEYPKDNKLTFYSLYRHTAQLSDYKGKDAYLFVTKSADSQNVFIKNQNMGTVAELENDLTIAINPNNKIGQNGSRHQVLWYKNKEGNIHRPANDETWSIYKGSYIKAEENTLLTMPLLTLNGLETKADEEVKLAKPIDVKAGTVLGLMGEYNQKEEQGKKLLHLEVFSYDDIEAFRTNAKAAYDKDKEKKEIQDNFLYVARDSRYYSIVEDKVVEIGKTSTEVMVPLSEIEKKTVKDGDKTKDYYNIQPYLHSTTVNGKTGIYVDNSHLTHGILFPGVNIYTEQSDGVAVFANGIHPYVDPENQNIEEKEKLSPLFKTVMDELDLDEEHKGDVKFEAVKLKSLLLNPIQQRRLTGIIVKHANEWESMRCDRFEKVCELFEQHNAFEEVTRIKKRINDLSIELKVNEFDTDKEAYYIHPLSLMNLSTYSESVFDWFETPLVKLIVSKESKGSYNAYNITGWNAKGKNTVYESHFEPTAQYHLEKMTITEIKTAQKTYIGPNKKHMLAVGIFQMIPATLNDFLRWLNKYKSINENSQLFDRKFQDLTPLYFWDKKRSNISAYFKGNKTVEHAAYAIAQEWASAAVPKDMRTVSGLVSNGNMSYYAGDGLNKAHYSADKTIKALEETKRIIDDAGGYEVVKELTLSTLKN